MKWIAGLCLLSSSLSTAFADQWTLVDSFLPADFAPGSATSPTSSGYWALGVSDGMSVLARYNTDGSVGFLRYPNMPNMQYDGAFKLTATPDGGVISTDVEDTDVLGYPACRMRRYDANGNLLWTSNLAQSALPNSDTCSSVAVDGTGGIWVYPGYLILVNPSDGTQFSQIDSPGLSNLDMMADPTQAAIYIAGAAQPDANTTLATIWKMTSQGMQWAAAAPAVDTGSMLDDVAVAADGSLWGFGNKGAQLYGMHVTATGNRLWSHAFTTTVNPVSVRVAARADGGVNTLHWDSTIYGSQTSWGPELSRFSSIGARVWHKSAGTRPPANAQLYQASLASVPNGDVLAAWNYYGGGQPDTNYYFQQTRVDVNGSSLFGTVAQTNPPRSGIQFEALPDYSSLTVTGSFEHLSRNGSSLSSPATSAITTATSYDDNEIMAPDATTYLLVQNPSDKHYGLSAYSSSGSLQWHTSLASSWSNGGLVDPILLLRSQDICLAGYLDGDEFVQCFTLVGGAAMPKRVLATGLSDTSTLTLASVTTNDQIVLLYRASDGALHHALIDVGGNLLHDLTPLQSGETWGATGQDANGDSIIATSNDSMLKLSADGLRAYSVPTDLAVSRVVVAPDGGAILSTAGTPVQVERVDASGQRLWANTMPSTGRYDFMHSPHFNGNDLYFVLTYSGIAFGGGPPPVMNSLLVKLAMADGAIDWSFPLTYVRGDTPRLVLNSGGDELFTFSTFGDRTQIRRYAMADGAVLGSIFEPCKVDSCVLYDAMLAPDGTLRMVHDTTNYASGSLFELTTIESAAFDGIFADGFE